MSHSATLIAVINYAQVEVTKGRIFVNRGTIAGKPIEDLPMNPLPGGWLKEIYGGPVVEHVNNFFNCVTGWK